MSKKYDCVKEIQEVLNKYGMENFLMCFGEEDDRERFTMISSTPTNDNLSKIAMYASKNQATNKLRYKDQISFADMKEFANKNAGNVIPLEGGHFSLQIYSGANQINILNSRMLPEWAIVYVDDEAQMFRCNNGTTDYNNPFTKTTDLTNVSPFKYIPGYIGALIKRSIKL
jgi:hypothetical protein